MARAEATAVHEAYVGSEDERLARFRDEVARRAGPELTATREGMAQLGAVVARRGRSRSSYRGSARLGERGIDRSDAALVQREPLAHRRCSDARGGKPPFPRAHPPLGALHRSDRCQLPADRPRADSPPASRSRRRDLQTALIGRARRRLAREGRGTHGSRRSSSFGRIRRPSKPIRSRSKRWPSTPTTGTRGTPRSGFLREQRRCSGRSASNDWKHRSAGSRASRTWRGRIER